MQSESKPRYLEGEVLIRFRQDVTKEQRLALEMKHYLVLLKSLDSISVWHYRLPSSGNVVEAIRTISQESIVEFCEPNHLRELNSLNDPGYSQQWYLVNSGQAVNGNTGVSGNDIRWPQASSLLTETNIVKVAVIDGGIALGHEDLTGRLLAGYDFFNKDADPEDENGHGTLVASILGSVSNNSKGIAGLCPSVRLMPLRVFGQFGLGNTPVAGVSDTVQAYDYARQNGARVINCSFGGGGYSLTELLALTQLRNAGILVVAAAGNGGSDSRGDNNDSTPFYPASYELDNIIAVAAVDRGFALAFFSNFGANSVDIAAPGVDIYGADVTRIAILFENCENGAPGWTVGRTALDFQDLFYGYHYNWVISSVGANHFINSGPFGYSYLA